MSKIVNLDEYRKTQQNDDNPKISVGDFAGDISFLIVMKMLNEFPEMNMKSDPKVIYDILYLEEQIKTIYARTTGQYYPQTKINDSLYEKIIPNPETYIDLDEDS